MLIRNASFFLLSILTCKCFAELNKTEMRERVFEMFMHGYNSYMKYAYPADELMPLSCQGRVRGVTPSRGDVDDCLGNFSLTLVDTLDTLVVIGALDEFERAVRLVVDNVRFDSDLIVSVFETNIRVLGGLLSGMTFNGRTSTDEGSLHVYNGTIVVNYLQWLWTSAIACSLLLTHRQVFPIVGNIAQLAYTLFSFEYSRNKMSLQITVQFVERNEINLRYGMLDHLKRQKDTCTACGGTMLLEMAALSRLTGNGLYEEKARKAMDFLWGQRHRASDLMGTVLNVHSGDWVRRESGIGAGIDSYYEYCLKAYILLGDKSFLERFDRHYEAVMRYVNKGPLFVDVHMHRPTVATRSFMDSLLAFWPGLQVLKGDVKRAIEMHEMLFQVVQKHKFLPEAFTHDFQVHWAEHPIRPEFIESTYFLYRATKDPHYLTVAKQVMESINQYVRVPCGFAGVKDVRTMSHEDRMDSFVLSETFKYLFMIFAEPSDLIFDPDNYVLTTEAHFLPLTIGNKQDEVPRRIVIRPDESSLTSQVYYSYANPVGINQLPTGADEALRIRERTQDILEELFDMQRQQQTHQSPQCIKPSERLRAWAFSTSNKEHIKQLRQMGIDVQVHEDGRMHLSHHTANGEVVTCEIDGNGIPSSLTSFAIRVSSPSVALSQMITFLMLILAIWLMLLSVVAVIISSSALIAVSLQMAKCGIEFMQEMLQLTTQREKESEFRGFRYLQVLTAPHFGLPIIRASPAQYGADLHHSPVVGEIAVAEPLRACSALTNVDQVRGRIAVVERSDCMFQEKSRHAQQAGAIAVIVVDHVVGTSSSGQPSFAMAEDKDSVDDIVISSVFIYFNEGQKLMKAASKGNMLVARLGVDPIIPNSLVKQFLMSGKSSELHYDPMCSISDGEFIQIDPTVPSVTFNFRFESVNQSSRPSEHQDIVERHVTYLQDGIGFDHAAQRLIFFNLMRTAAYTALGLNIQDENLKTVEGALRSAYLIRLQPIVYEYLHGDITQVRCLPRARKISVCSNTKL
ncbi:PA domain protein [Dictyocaulus viviparus]|uniref:alpha-1,2-Mannosidase n=1 Tax=Dictyocaulus viviparus TaxID=29172 RepID=A0A0D8X8L0_DICVI|nr:PA domain protein [Dictyocaulus viviparus]